MHKNHCIEVIALGKVYPKSRSENQEIIALTNINLNIKPGESVGIIGLNGAGKSTLLKVLSKVTPPSAGEAFIRGTFSSLMEVGTGLHPELSGNDNVFLYGTLLGLSFKEIRALKDEIVEFSGLKQFMDLPVKKYSSGMKLRLAFSVMAHLPSDILALDEVLAVGDSLFQQKCIKRMLGIKDNGRTLLFVSHDLAAVKTICERTVVLEKGSIVFDGPTDEAIAFYRSAHSTITSNHNLSSCKRTGNLAWFESLNFKPETLATDTAIEAGIQFGSSATELLDAEIGVNIRSMVGQNLYHFSNRFSGQNIQVAHGSVVQLCFEHQLKPGRYKMSLFLRINDEIQQWIENEITFEITGAAPYGFVDSSQIQADLTPSFTLKNLEK